MRHLSVLLALGCGRPPEPELDPNAAAAPDAASAAPDQEPAPPNGGAGPAAPFTPTPEQQAMIRALSHKDGGPDCASIEALAADPVPALVELVDRVQVPPVVPMGAAGCLLERHAAQVESDIVRWVTGEHTRGLALLAASSLDRMEPEVAVRVARAALSGPHAAQVRGRVARAADPEVRALVEVTP